MTNKHLIVGLMKYELFISVPTEPRGPRVVLNVSELYIPDGMSVTEPPPASEETNTLFLLTTICFFVISVIVSLLVVAFIYHK